MELKRDFFSEEIKRAKSDPKFVEELIQAVHPARQVREVREMASQVLMVLAEDAPALISAEADIFYEYLSKKNAFSKMVAVYCLTGLVLAGLEPEFSSRIDQFLSLLHDESVMIASHCALNAGRIASQLPVYEPRITDHFLKVKDISHKQKDLILAYVIGAFESYAAHSTRVNEIHALIWQQLESASPKARQAARQYLTHAGLL